MSMGGWPKIIRDPVHDIISFKNNRCDRLLFELLDTREFQRLRRIRQLGMCELVFPGATHTRLAHSLGVMHLARKMYERICLHQGKDEEEHKVVVLAAALLHDIGHGPFSHTFEAVTKISHEVRTVDIILSDETEVNAVLKKHDSALPEMIASFIDTARGGKGAEVPGYLKQIVSSQLDADRFDYLLRDSHFTGTEYGRYDLRWLLEHIHVDETHGLFYLDSKSLAAVEGYIFARYHMYRTVYFHKTVRSAEIMFKLLFERFKEIGKENNLKKWKNIVPDAPENIFNAFAGSLPLADFLGLDDMAALTLFRACTTSKDNVLKKLGDGLIHRNLYKSVELPELNAEMFQFRDDIKEKIKAVDEYADYSLIEDTTPIMAYQPYTPDEEGADKKLIMVGDSMEQAQEILTVSPAVRTLTDKYQRMRFFYPAKHQSIVDNCRKCHYGGQL